MLPTVAVTCTAFDQNGNPVVGGRVVATLDRTEIHGGFVVPERVEGVTNAQGVCVLQLWPNELGVAGSSYQIRAWNPDTGKRYLDTRAVVPNRPTRLEDIISLEPFPPVDVVAQSVSRAATSATAATNAATSATTSATAATNAATSAATSATAATNAATSATTSATAATNASLLTVADRTKLDGIQAAATANATDAALRDRGTHTGTQAPATIMFAATDRILGRVTAGAGPGEEIVVTAVGRALISDADAAAQRATLGLGNVNNTPDALKPVSTAQAIADARNTTTADIFADFVVSGLLSPTSASLTSTLSAGTAYVIGQRVVVAATPFTYAPSSDTYDDLANSGVITRVVVATGAAAPALTANSLRLQMVMTSATAVTAVTRVARLAPFRVDGVGRTVAGFGFPQHESLQVFGSQGAGVIVFGPAADQNWCGGLQLSNASRTITAAINASSNGMSIAYKGVQRLAAHSAGGLGVRVSTPTAILHLMAGSSALNGGPLKLTAGPLLTAPEVGTIEYDNDWRVTDSTGVRRRIASTNFTAAPSSITVGASPFVHQNATGFDADVIVSGGTVSLIEFSRDGTAFFALGQISGMFRVSPLDRLRVTYSAVPTMTLIPR